MLTISGGIKAEAVEFEISTTSSKSTLKRPSIVTVVYRLIGFQSSKVLACVIDVWCAQIYYVDKVSFVNHSKRSNPWVIGVSLGYYWTTLLCQ